ncbi:lysylphosphatidylglycerol synthase domain-containing protein [Actinomadura madurae]|uniref:lysylphosphatidylglycerol synthase domain-containing protein n=1 Tax=Actinomadura madurae TaxID=1993 RepID=UPI000D988852|nr:lysylphosphatidylglycerol synthase domain-containing protein [Actinomadura madurae]SPT51149.1 serine/threonine protein kinase [Actinomadura madurae]
MRAQTAEGSVPTNATATGDGGTRRGRRRAWFGRVLALLIVTAIFGKVLPDLVDLEKVGDILRTRVDLPELVLLSVFTVLSVLASAVGLSAALPGLRIAPASVINVVTTALSYALPGGGAAGAALNVTMSRDLGFRSAPIALQVLVTGLWNLVTRMTLPLLALGLLAMASDVPAEARGAGVLGLASAAIVIGLTIVMLWHDRAAVVIVAAGQRAVRRLMRLLHRDVRDHSDGVARFQADARELIRDRWPALTVSSIGYHVCVFAVLYVSLQATGVSRVGVLEAFTVYTVARQVTAIPLTPGSAGVLDLALIGGLDLTGADLPAATAGVLLFRFFTYLLYLPVGGILWLWWRWGRPMAANRPHEVAFRHPMDVTRLLLALGGLAVLVAVSRGVPRWDVDMFRLVNDLPDAIELPVWLVMQAGWIGAAAAAAVTAAAFRRFRFAVALGMGGTLAWILAKVIKETSGRPRPAAVLDGVVLRADATPWGTGFVAGHTAVAAALVTIAGGYLSRPYRRVLWLAVVAVGAARMYVGAHFPVDVLGGAALGWAVGASVLLLAGASGHRPRLTAVREVLTGHGLTMTAAERLHGDLRHAVPFAVTTPAGRLFVKIIGRDQRDADTLHRLGRLWRRRPGEPPFATAKHLAEHEGYLLMRAQRAGARVPAVRFVAEADPGSWALVMDHIDACTLARAGGVGPETLDDLWRQCAALRHHRIAHRDLSPENVLVDQEGRPWIVGWSRAETDTTQRLLDEDAARLLTVVASVTTRARALAAARRTLDPVTYAGLITRPQNPTDRMLWRAFFRRPGSPRLSAARLALFPPKTPVTARHPADVVRLVAGLGICLLLSLFAADGLLLRPEADAFRLVNDLPGWLFRPVDIVMQTGSLGAVAVTATAALAARRFRLTADLALGGSLAWLIAKLVKDLADRGRPGALLSEVVLRGAHEGGLGFVSGHAAVAAALATVAAAHVRRPVRWVLWGVAIAVPLSRVYVGAHFPLDVVAGAALGWAIGGAVHLARGTPNHVPTTAQVASGLARCGLDEPVAEPLKADARGSVPFTAVTRDGRAVFVKALGRDQRDADLLFKAARFLLYREVEDETPMASPKRQVEHEAYMLMRAAAAGARVPAVIGVAPAGSGTWLLVEEAIKTGADEPRSMNDRCLRQIWTEVARLRAARIAHRDLRLANILIDAEDRPVLVDFGFAEDAAGDGRLAQDVAELLVSTSLVTGPDRSVRTAIDVLGLPAVEEAAQYLQPLAMAGSTRAALRNQPRLLEELRTTLAGEGATRVMPRPLSRIPSRPWVLLLLALAGYVTYHGLIGITGLRAPMDAVADARIRWLLVASVLVAVSYAAGALALMGASVRDLAFGRTFLRQVAASYASRQHLAGRGGDAVLGAHLREHGAGPHEATETVALTRLIGALVHLIALVLALVSVAAQGGEPLRTPSWSVPVILTVTTVAALGAVLLWRRRAEIVLPLAAAVAGLPRLARRPRHLIALLTGSSAVTTCSVLAFLAVGHAMNVPLSPAVLAATYLLLKPLRLLGPLPGGLGIVEPVLVLALVTLGTGPTEAFLTVLIYRILSFWLPVLPGALLLHKGTFGPGTSGHQIRS